MALQTLNSSVIQALPNPDHGQKVYFDTKLKGFGVRVTQNAKTYICESRVKGRKRRVSIAPVGTLTVAEARKEAQKQLGMMATDVDPNKVKAEQRAKGITFEEAKIKFLEKPKLGEKTRYDYRGYSMPTSQTGTSVNCKVSRPKCSPSGSPSCKRKADRPPRTKHCGCSGQCGITPAPFI